MSRLCCTCRVYKGDLREERANGFGMQSVLCRKSMDTVWVCMHSSSLGHSEGPVFAEVCPSKGVDTIHKEHSERGNTMHTSWRPPGSVVGPSRLYTSPEVVQSSNCLLPRQTGIGDGHTVLEAVHGMMSVKVTRAITTIKGAK